MMTRNQIEIARELATHERWEWPINTGVWHPKYGTGTIVGDDPMMVSFQRTGQLCHANKEGLDCLPDLLPDLADDATAGVLLGMWRESTGRSGQSAFTVCAGLAAHAPIRPLHPMAELFALMLLDVWG